MQVACKVDGRKFVAQRIGAVVWTRIMGYLTLDLAEWAEENFGSCELEDARRTRRAVKVARQMAEHPDGSSPDQTEIWSDLKAAYRLFDCDDVTFESLASPHWQRTRLQARGDVLLIGDTTETDFGYHRCVEGLGPTGDGYGLGFFLHSSMMVNPRTGEIMGLAGQELFYRQPAPKHENSYQALQRTRESEVWGRVIDDIGPPVTEARYIHVFDRGADNLDVFCHCQQQRTEWVIRAAQLHRKVENKHGTKRSLRAMLEREPLSGTYEIQVRATKKHPARTAKMHVRFTRVSITSPKRKTRYQRSINFSEMTQWVVETCEVRAPKGVKPLHWVLWTSLPVENVDDAWRIIEYYEQRWLIEEFHKAIKTGCRLESRQYQQAHRLEAVAGMTCVLAVRLVQLKTIAITQPETPAANVVPKIWLQMLQSLRKKNIVTVRDFFRHLAGLGGFLMRKGDGEPGWITLWRGLDKLLLAIRGYQSMKKKCG